MLIYCEEFHVTPNDLLNCDVSRTQRMGEAMAALSRLQPEDAEMVIKKVQAANKNSSGKNTIFPESRRMSQAYAVLSKKINPDGRHWYRVRAMMGDRCKKACSDAGGLLIGNDDFSIIVPNGYGDGETRYAVLERNSFNSDMLTYFTSFTGKDIRISDYDCDFTGGEKISGHYSVYYCDGLIVLERGD